MPDTNTENQLLLANSVLNRRIALLEEMLLEKDRAGAAQVQQILKMEAVGLFVGGVAHDFNNMLTVILGRAELALRKADPSQSLYADLKEIIETAKKSTAITRQLLTFAREQKNHSEGA